MGPLPALVRWRRWSHRRSRIHYLRHLFEGSAVSDIFGILSAGVAVSVEVSVEVVISSLLTRVLRLLYMYLLDFQYEIRHTTAEAALGMSRGLVNR